MLTASFSALVYKWKEKRKSAIDMWINIHVIFLMGLLCFGTSTPGAAPKSTLWLCCGLVKSSLDFWTICMCSLISLLKITGGQKSRVAFAKITFKKPHIILLDEPSNHLVSVVECWAFLLGNHCQKVTWSQFRFNQGTNLSQMIPPSICLIWLLTCIYGQEKKKRPSERVREADKMQQIMTGRS